MAETLAADAPDGLETHSKRRLPTWSGILILGAIVATGASGLLGGAPSPEITIDSPAAKLAVKTPHILRNGTLFETRIRITAHHNIARPVVKISETLWQDTTINSFIPAPSEEALEPDGWAYTLAPLEAGQSVTLHIDGQNNPPLVGTNEGRISLYDGDAHLVAMPLSVRILP